ncbi:MAG: methylated-DNA--[protein]-cysteine S-methyltransferase [Actinobacteria bacterium]|nr:methylated-DNA--[protein]-cysteine S-methyltransferase [Actinomycetota bacterium]
MGKTVIETRAGYMGLGWTGSGLAFLNLPAPTLYEAEMEMKPYLGNRFKGVTSVKEAPGPYFSPEPLERELKAYFEGKPVDLSFPVDWSFYTDFQRRVLQRVYSIPWGEVLSYGQVGMEVGSPRGARAVGGAVGSNRVLLIIPCHRVIAHNGIGGFGGGLERKRMLLGIEGIKI